MIDDTGTRITALERRVAEIEARLPAQPIPAANSSDAPTLAEAMEALRYACEIHGDDRIFNAAPNVLAAWDRERPAGWTLERDTWKARAEAGDKLLKTAADLIYQSNDVDEYREVEKAIRAHLWSTP